ncbi:response regulator transcription factor [Ciceribacter sp. L1K23]|uniref:response regulator transcription factor n=1 Tax=Ciceribacter sp. L1K23 TaxID=2820276 RepID=UPI001B82CBF0|nr:LuxR C-terminal-related transcriptional regulator [Ciceribacter sp. L1K23]MBR0555465.1 response regulator transcription factor [Ciceribacter sp. L1K23]
MAFSEVRKREFIDETFRLLSGTLGASRLVFYSVDDNNNLHNFVCSRVPSEFLKIYIREMHAHDPLHVRQIEHEQNPVVKMTDARRYAPESEVALYRQFLDVFKVSNTIELIFQRDRQIYAGISVMWTADDSMPTDDQFHLADTLHPYIAFNLKEVLPTPKAVVTQKANALLHLTQREAEVARLLCCGRTNADIAQCLGIGLATVKTHLIHIFDKAGVDNRAALVSRMMQFG